jgi:hypothetical protein
MPKRSLIPALLLAAALLPAQADAQYRLPQPSPQRFVMEPYAGAFFDNVARQSISFDHAGPLAGLRLGMAVAPSLRLLGDVAYSWVGDVEQHGAAGNHHVLGSRNFLTTAGVEWEAVPGDVGGVLGLQVGSLWRALEVERTVGVPVGAAPAEGYSAHAVLVPSVAMRIGMSARSDVKLTLQQYIRLDEPTSQSPALTVGFSFR